MSKKEKPYKIKLFHFSRKEMLKNPFYPFAHIEAVVSSYAIGGFGIPIKQIEFDTGDPDVMVMALVWKNGPNCWPLASEAMEGAS